MAKTEHAVVAGLDDFIKACRNGNTTNAKEIAQQLVAVFGGAVAIAAEFKRLYDDDETNPATKSRMLEQMLYLVRVTYEKSDDDLSDVDPEDLKAEARQLYAGNTFLPAQQMAGEGAPETGSPDDAGAYRGTEPGVHVPPADR